MLSSKRSSNLLVCEYSHNYGRHILGRLGKPWESMYLLIPQLNKALNNSTKPSQSALTDLRDEQQSYRPVHYARRLSQF